MPLALVLSLLAQSLLVQSQTPAEEPAEKPPTAALQYAHGAIRIPAASADEPNRKDVSAALAQKYLKDGSLAWNGKHKCISCHTNGTYMVVRPALSQTLGRPDAANRKFFISELESLATENPKKLQRGVVPAQIIYLAAGLAEWDRARERAAFTRDRSGAAAHVLTSARTRLVGYPGLLASV